MTVEMEGIPYSDCFAVEVRWVAQREGDNDIFVQVGVFVNFKKSTMLKGKIRSGTLEETTSTHESLFESVQKACIAAGGEAAPEADEVSPVPIVAKENALSAHPYVIAAGIICLLYIYYIMRPNEPSVRVLSSDTEYLGERIDYLEGELAKMQQKLDVLLGLLQEQGSGAMQRNADS